MDPNEALAQLRELASATDASMEDASFRAEELSSRFADLDEWLTGGGFKPAAWMGGA